LLSAAIMGAAAVGAGAFGAHGLESHLKKRESIGGDVARALAAWETAAEYQMYHALALLGLGVLTARDGAAEKRRGRSLAMIAGSCFLGGALIFSGSLYALVLTKISKLGMITPIGGLLLIAGWLAMAGAVWSRSE
jgi:uncharacterized membrane protein YgdD (TMEM256/DUF423 family)